MLQYMPCFTIPIVLENKPIPVIKNDGTQFIWAGDLARLYLEVLNSQVNRKTYFGLSKNFVSWAAVAREAVKRSNSRSQIQLEDKGWSDEGLSWDVSDMKKDFGLEFDAWDRIVEHLDYYIDLERSR
jgi:UDP-glucose 4-epimerase